MNKWQEFLFIIRQLNRKRADHELDEEIHAHLELEIQQRIDDGLPPDEARLKAIRVFGGTVLAKERSREMWGLRSWEILRQDVYLGTRRLIKSPGFTVIALLSLALGIGANASIFSLVNTILLRPLPVENPEKLVDATMSNKDHTTFVDSSYPNYVDYRDRNQVFSGLAAYRSAPMSLSRGGNNERLWGYIVSGNYFDVLGVKAAAGRTFLPQEDRTQGTHPVAIVSYSSWQHRFGGDPELVGRTITLNGLGFTVIGIATKEFNGTEVIFSPEIWVTMMMAKQIEPDSAWLDDRGSGTISMIGRLKPGISRGQAVASLDSLNGQLAQEYPETNEGKTMVLSTPGLGSPTLRDPVLVFAGFLMIVVGVVLLIACTNLANLLLARATRRRKEIAICLSLGANRIRLVRQLLTESVLLSLVGGIAGIALAIWINTMAVSLKPPGDFPIAIDLHMDWRVIMFTMLISLATGMLFGLVPALQTTRPDLIPSLKDQTTASGPGNSRLRNTLVVAQVALSLVLLIVAGLIVRSLQNAQSLNPGFNVSNTLQARIELGLQGYDGKRSETFYRDLIERVRALPGVTSVSMTDRAPLDINGSNTSFYVEGTTLQRGANKPLAYFGSIAPKYFQTLGIPLVEGRDFTEQDRDPAAHVVIINETMARNSWPGQSAIGKRISFALDGPFMEIVGVAKDGKYRSLGESPQQYLYIPLSKGFISSVAILVRTSFAPDMTVVALRGVIQNMDRSLPIFQAETLANHMSISLFPVRVAASLLGVFGLLALVLAAVGIYGVMSYSVSQRTREIGLRMALGAQVSDVLKLIVGQGLFVTFVGMAIGLVMAIALTHFMASLLLGLKPTDPLTFGAISLTLAIVALLACYVPARRATKVDPMIALRYE